MTQGNGLLRIGLVGVLALFMASAHADIVTMRTNLGNFHFAGPEVNVPNDTLTFFVVRPDRYVVSYTAECAVFRSGASNGVWMDIDIRIIGPGINTELRPTNGDLDAFCTSNGTNADDGWVMAAVNAQTPRLQRGWHRVWVQARTSNNVADGHLGDRSLLVAR